MKVEDAISYILGVFARAARGRSPSGGDAVADHGSRIKVKDILTDASKWTKFADARDAKGRECDVGDDLAVAFCLAGALRRAYSGEELVAAIDRIEEVIGPIPDDILSIQAWNDNDRRTFAEVRRVIEQADV